MMGLRVERAVFGELRDGHSLLTASVPDSLDLRTLTRYTDLPLDMPPGLIWEPFVRAFSLGNWYVITKTFPHPGASRTGMVKTFALLLDLDEAGKCKNFPALLALLPTNLTEDWPADAGEIELADDDLHRDPTGFPALVRAIVEAESQPVVWLGHEGFLDAISALWFALWPQARRQLRIGFYFAPRDLPAQSLNVILVQRSLAARWTDFPAVEQDSPVSSDPSAAEGYLRGLPIGESVREVFSRLGVEPSTFQDLQIAAKCSGLNAQGESASLGELRALLRYLVLLSHLPENGSSWKENTLERLVAKYPSGDADDIIALRTFYELPLPDISNRTDRIVAKWLINQLAKAQRADDCFRVLNEALKSPGTNWAVAVLNTLREVWITWRQEFADVVWAWWLRDPASVSKFGPYLPKTASVETSFVSVSPGNLLMPVASSVRALAAERSWYKLHAAACAASLSNEEAFTTQLSVDRESSSLDGLQFLAERLPASALVAAALKHDERRLLSLAAKACVSQPELLRPWDIRHLAWQHLLSETLGVSAAAWTTLGKERVGLRDELLHQLLSGKADEMQIWHAISISPDADLTTVARRGELWKLLPSATRERFLKATAAGWVTSFQKQPGFEKSLESLLASHVFPSNVQPPLLDVSIPLAAEVGLEAFTHFEQLNEWHFCKWLPQMSAARRNVQESISERLGDLIFARGWSEAAKTLFDIAMLEPDWRIAAQRCSGLVGFLRKFRFQFRFGKEQMSLDQFWRALEELAAKLYPSGPESNELWSRAGGEGSELPTRGTGVELWGAAIRLLRHGGGKKLTVRSLLTTMLNQFGRNEGLRELSTFARDRNL